MLVTTLIKGFFLIVGYTSGIIQLHTAIVNIKDFLVNYATYVPIFSTYVGYVYFFIPKNILAPLIAVTLGTLTVRIFSAIVNLIWW